MLLVADAAGHGIGPALAVTKLQAMLRMFGQPAHPAERRPGVHQSAVVRIPCRSAAYVAAVVGVLDPVSHRVHTFTAGLSAAFMVSPEGRITTRNADALALAIEPDWAADTGREEEIPPGGALVIMTDGYPEARDDAGAMLGMQGVEASLVRAVANAASASRPAQSIIDSLEADMAAFVGDVPAADDRTAIVVYRRAAGQ